LPMETIFFIIFILLSAIIAFLVYRIIHFFVISKKKKEEDKEGETGRINAFLLPIFFLSAISFFLWHSFTDTRKYFREASSIHGIEIDKMFWITVLITGIVFLVTQVLLFYFPFRYRHKEGTSALYYPNNFTIEILWTLIPFFTLMGLFYFSSALWKKITSEAPKDALAIEIMAEQFNWRVRYPGMDNKFGAHHFSLISEENDFGIDVNDSASLDDFAPAQLHLPKGRPVLFKIRSRDVVHSVYIPQFRLKMDAVPGMPTGFHFTPVYSTQEMRDKSGNPNFNYELACAELCGRSHFVMLFIVVVDEEEDFKKWYRKQKPLIATTALQTDQNQ
jgi:cytochrome c oxidase subunit II